MPASMVGSGDVLPPRIRVARIVHDRQSIQSCTSSCQHPAMLSPTPVAVTPPDFPVAEYALARSGTEFTLLSDNREFPNRCLLFHDYL
jgi:hypothetical protein